MVGERIETVNDLTKWLSKAPGGVNSTWKVRVCGVDDSENSSFVASIVFSPEYEEVFLEIVNE